MKKFHVVAIDRTNRTVRSLSNGGSRIITSEDKVDGIGVGYDTFGAAKRMTTIVSQNPPAKFGIVGMELDTMEAEAILQLVAEFAAPAPMVDEKAKAEERKEDLRKLMRKYYPEREKELAAQEANGPDSYFKAQEKELEALAGKDNEKGHPKVTGRKKPVDPKPKDPTKVTEKELVFLTNMRKDAFYTRGVDSILWVPVLADTLLATCDMNKMTMGALVSTLREKGMLVTGEDKHDNAKMKYIQLTDLGKATMHRYGLD